MRGDGRSASSAGTSRGPRPGSARRATVRRGRSGGGWGGAWSRGAARLVVLALCGPVAAFGAIAAPSDAGPPRPDDRLAVARHAAHRAHDLRLSMLFGDDAATPATASRDGPGGALSVLVDAARGSTDPLVLELLVGHCRTTPVPCDARDLADRWTRVDAENAVAWVELAAVLDAAGDRAGADAAWQRAGRASTARDSQFAFARIALSAFAATTDPRERVDDLVTAIGIAVAVPAPWFADVRTGCRIEARRDACRHVADVVFRDAQTLAALGAARGLTAQVGDPSWLQRERLSHEKALQWAASQADRASGLGDAADGRTTDRATAQRIVNLLEARVGRGEVAVARDELRAQRVSDEDAARRYTDDMNALMKRLQPP